MWIKLCGETTNEIREWIDKHRSTIHRVWLDLPVAKEFNERWHSVSQLRFRVIDSVLPLRREGDHEAQVQKKEFKCIYTLQSLQPQELNMEFDLNW